MTKDRVVTELAQKVQARVEEWADGCEHTMDDPEDCLSCTIEMLGDVVEIIGMNATQKARMQLYLARNGLSHHAPQLAQAINGEDHVAIPEF